MTTKTNTAASLSNGNVTLPSETGSGADTPFDALYQVGEVNLAVDSDIKSFNHRTFRSTVHDYDAVPDTGAAYQWAWNGFTRFAGRIEFLIRPADGAINAILDLITMPLNNGAFYARIGTDNKIYLTELSGASTLAIANTTTALQLSTWYRLEWEIDLGAGGAYNVRLYQSLTTTTASDTLQAARAWGSDTTSGNASFGQLVARQNNMICYFDNLTLTDNAGLPGPYREAGVVKQNTFSDGTPGAAITVGNSGGDSGDAFDAVSTNTANATITYDTKVGKKSAKFAVTTTDTHFTYLRYEFDRRAFIAGRMELYLTGYPSALYDSHRLFHIPGTSGSVWVDITNAGKLRVMTDTGYTTVVESAMQMPLGQWIRIEWDFAFWPFAGGSLAIKSSYELLIFNSPSDTTPAERVFKLHLNPSGMDSYHSTNAFSTREINFNSYTFEPATSFWTTNILANNRGGLPGPYIASLDMPVIALEGTTPIPTSTDPISPDNFADARTVQITSDGGIYTDSVVMSGFSREPNEPVGGYKTAWWRYEPLTSGSVTLSTVGSGVDTLLGLYSGTVLDTLTLVDSDDDSGGGPGESWLSSPVTGGTTYYVRVATYDNFTNGTFEVSVSGPATHDVAPPVIDAPPMALQIAADGRVGAELDNVEVPVMATTIELDAAPFTVVDVPPLDLTVTTAVPSTVDVTLTVLWPDLDDDITTSPNPRPELIFGVDQANENVTFTIDVQIDDNISFTSPTTYTEDVDPYDGGITITPTADLPADGYMRARLRQDDEVVVDWTAPQNIQIAISGGSTAAQIPISWSADPGQEPAVHLWFIEPGGGKPGEKVTVFGHGFPDPVRVSIAGVEATVNSRTLVAASGVDADERSIAPYGLVDPQHYELVITVPEVEEPGGPLVVEAD